MSLLRCPHCGTANRAGSNFCNSCGVDLRATEDAESPSASQQPEPPAQAPSEEAEPPRPAPSMPDRQEPDAGQGAPWLHLDFEHEAGTLPFDEEESEEPSSEPERLLSRVPDMLSPVRITVSGDAPEDPSSQVSGETTESQAEFWRSVRTRMETPPLLAGFSLPGSHMQLTSLRLRWLFLILALAVTVPAFSVFAWPSGSATEWPGVQEAFDAIDGLPPNANILIYWAYDPATAGELDLEALPMTAHLFQRRARITVVTLLPGGPATARRLVNRARLEFQHGEPLTVAAQSTWTVPYIYLPGGASILALVAQAPSLAFGGIGMPATPTSSDPPDPPAMSIVFAAQADDVQHWLEQVQPLNQTPVIAAVGAAADPAVRPYLDSGQLIGLVSGFDGAYSYRRLLDEQTRTGSLRQLDMQLVLQDWGHFVFFLVIVGGNFVSVLRRGGRGR